MSSDNKATTSADTKATTPATTKTKKKVQKTSSRAPGADRSADELNRQELARISSASSSYGASGSTASPGAPTGTTR
jgi:hypothetical protein